MVHGFVLDFGICAIHPSTSPNLESQIASPIDPSAVIGYVRSLFIISFVTLCALYYKNA